MLRRSTDEWERFIRLPAWGEFTGHKPTVDDRDAAIRFALRYMIGFGRNRNERVSRSIAALEDPFNDKLSVSELRQRIKAAGGLQKLARANKERRRQGATLEEKRERVTEVILVHDNAGELLLELARSARATVELELIDPREGKTTFKIVAVAIRDGAATAR